MRPLRSVTRSSVPSWKTTRTPSAVTRTSVSMYRYPRSTHASKADMEFSEVLDGATAVRHGDGGRPVEEGVTHGGHAFTLVGGDAGGRPQGARDRRGHPVDDRRQHVARGGQVEPHVPLPGRSAPGPSTRATPRAPGRSRRPTASSAPGSPARPGRCPRAAGTGPAGALGEQVRPAAGGCRPGSRRTPSSQDLAVA